MDVMRVKGVQGIIEFDGTTIVITKKGVGQRPREFRILADEVTGTHFKPGNWAFNGYVRFVLPGSLPAPESKSLISGGRPPHTDPHSLSIRRGANEAAEKLIAAVERARG
ncbi:DUF4429 domain-containing protein [Streptomyces sp. CA-251247]|uniref:DUF4429 domain-containing protein n=1 Tax=Streptomyces sp. CA-251247 TaxID=3240062 RepID=UPI003D8BD3F5